MPRDAVSWTAHVGTVGTNGLKWVESYLERRSQSVKVQNLVSSQQEVTIGIPQGSVLGRLSHKKKITEP